MTDKHDDSHEEATKLDDDSSEEATKLDEDILITTKQLQNVINPDEVKLGENIANNTKVNEFYEMIKNMPRGNVMQLMANMAKSSKLPKHNFVPVTDQKKDKIQERLRKKLENLKLKKLEEEHNKKLDKLSDENNKKQSQIDSNNTHQNNDKSAKPKKKK